MLPKITHKNPSARVLEIGASAVAINTTSRSGGAGHARNGPGGELAHHRGIVISLGGRGA